MIKLRNNPIEGSSVKLALNFKDPVGQYYIPITVNYTFLALNSDKATWSVVDNLYQIPLEPASSISLVIPDIKLIEGTELGRKIIVRYQAFIDNEYVDFIDEVQFEVQPMPIVKYDGNTPEPQVYVQVVSCDLIAGSLITTPLEPIFKMRVNMPITVEDTHITVINKDTVEDDIICSFTVDMTQTVLNISPNVGLNLNTNYQLKVEGLKSKIGDYELKEPYVLNFITRAGDPKIQPEKDITIVENGNIEVLPDGESEGIAKVNIHTEIPLEEEKSVSYTEPGDYEITPSLEYTAVKKINVNVDISGKIESEREVTITENGVSEIEPESEYLGLSKVKINTEIPLEDSQEITVTNNGSLTVTPSSGYTALKKVIFHVNTEGTKSLYAYSSNSGILFFSTNLIGTSGNYKLLPDPTVSNKGFGIYTILRVGTSITFDFEGVEQVLTRQSSADIAR